MQIWPNFSPLKFLYLLPFTNYGQLEVPDDYDCFVYLFRKFIVENYLSIARTASYRNRGLCPPIFMLAQHAPTFGVIETPVAACQIQLQVYRYHWEAERVSGRKQACQWHAVVRPISWTTHDDETAPCVRVDHRAVLLDRHPV